MTTAPRVVVALHAHPDDESLLTGGTLAALARRGHRVVLIVATDGSRGLTKPGVVNLADRRDDELRRAAAVLGVARLVRLGYRDSGDHGTAVDGFCFEDPAAVVDRVAAVVTEEHAALLIGYDERGGYGHPDHRQVHAVALAVAQRTGTRLLMATVDRTWLQRGMRLAARCHVLPTGSDPDAAAAWYSARGDITHRVRVRRQSGVKRRAISCYGSQSTGGGGIRTVRLLSLLPLPLFALVAGTEWFVEPDAVTQRQPRSDLFTPATKDAP